MQFGPRTLLFVILLLAMPIAAFLLMFKPLNQQKLMAQRDTQVKQEKLTQLNNVMMRNKDMPAEIDRLRQAIDLLKKRMPDQREMDQVLKEVWQIAGKNNLNAKSVRSLKTIDGAGYSEQPIKMVIVGSFADFYKFLSDVEQLPRLTRINDMKIDVDDKSTDGLVTADLVLTIYFESNQKVVVAP